MAVAGRHEDTMNSPSNPDQENVPVIFKIVDADAWAMARRAGRFDGAPVDLADGFIHFSAPHQVAETARKHFLAQPNLLLVAVKSAALGAALKWEISRGGQRFPHLFAPLPVEAVLWEAPLPLDGAGIPIVDAVLAAAPDASQEEIGQEGTGP